jgi:hypothetical protein
MTQENVVIDDYETEALRRWESGEKPSFSTGICESLTAGYGKLDDHGYWEFQLPYPAEQWMTNRQKQMTLWESVVVVSDRIHNRRSEQDVFNKLIEEVGELAIEISVLTGNTYKKGGPDGVVGEAIDAINCLIDLIRIYKPDLTEADLAEIAHFKQLKWERFAIEQKIAEDERRKQYAESLRSGWQDKKIEGR